MSPGQVLQLVNSSYSSRLDSTRLVDSTRLDSTRLDSTRLDSTRVYSSLLESTCLLDLSRLESTRNDSRVDSSRRVDESTTRQLSQLVNSSTGIARLCVCCILRLTASLPTGSLAASAGQALLKHRQGLRIEMNQDRRER